MIDRLPPLLAAHSLFAPLSDAARKEIAELFVELPLDPGERLFRPGDAAQDFFVVLEGEVALQSPGAPLATRGPGDGFGELGLVPGQVRRATVTGGEQGARVAKLPRLAFERLLEEDLDAYRSFQQALEERLRPLGLLVPEARDRSAMLGSPRIFAFGAPRDGVGRSTLAVNFATTLAIEGMRVALVDLDPTGGDVALLTDVDPVRSWTDLFDPEGGEPDLSPARLEAHAVPGGCGLFVFPAPPRAEAARGPSPQEVASMIEGLGRAFDAVVVDAPAGSGALAEAVLHAADLALVVGNYSVQGIFALNRMLAALGRAGLRYGRLQVILDRVGRTDDAPLEEREALLVPAITRVLEDEDVARSAGEGIPDVLRRPGGTMAQACRRLWKRLELVRRHRPEPPQPRERRGRARSLVALGRALFLRGAHPEAAEKLEAAAVDLPADPEATILLGRIYEERGEVRRAAACYKAALAADPEDLHSLARAAALTENPAWVARARKRLARARSRFPARADYPLLEGLLDAAEGDLGAADHNFAQALALHPDYTEAHRRRGDLARRAGNPEGAVAHYRKATALFPVEPAAWWGLTQVFEAQGLVGPALEACRTLLAKIPDHAEAQRKRRVLAEAVARVDDEIASYDQALLERPGFPDVLLLRAGAHARKGDAARASQDAAEALRSGAALPGARLLLRLIRVMLTPAAAVLETEAAKAA